MSTVDEVLAGIPAPVLDEIGIERERQKLIEGYSTHHDDDHDCGELVSAAICFAGHRDGDDPPMPREWPFEEPFKPKEHRRNLIVAAALLVAEIERLDRKAANEKVPA